MYMAKNYRINIGDQVYHVYNRANARAQIFYHHNDYLVFEQILEDSVKKFGMRLLAYCLMPNHWHFVLYPRKDGDLSRFMEDVSKKHSKIWHYQKDVIGQGHLYQSRFKSDPVLNDTHFLNLVRYVERNALSADLVKNAENWQWSSGWRRKFGSLNKRKILSKWPVPISDDYSIWLNASLGEIEENKIEIELKKSTKLAKKQFNIPWGVWLPKQ